MPALHNREHDTQDHRPDFRDQSPRQSDDDREISLGTGTILAIFFALALVCAVFFGLGYSMGRKSAAQGAAAAASSPDPAPSSSIFSGFKPSAGNPGTPPSSTPKKNAEATASQPPADPDANIVTSPVSSDPEVEVTAPASRATTASHRGDPPPAAPIVRESSHPTSAPSQAAQPAAPAISPNGTALVQVAAVSHQEDADVLTSALKKRGYAVFIRQEPQDHLLHVQVGPFATRKDAEVMRQRLLADGYNAIVK